MKIVLERSSIDKPLTIIVGLMQIQFPYQCVDLMHAKVFSIQMFQYFSQIAPRVYYTIGFTTDIIVTHQRRGMFVPYNTPPICIPPLPS